MYYKRLNYDLNNSPLENVVALFNKHLKAGIPALKLEESEIIAVERLEDTNVTDVSVGECVNGEVVDSVKVRLIAPSMGRLLNDLQSFMLMEYTTWGQTEASDFKASLQYAAKLQGWDLSKQITIEDVALGKDALGSSVVIITQSNPFYKPQYVFTLPLKIYDVNVSVAPSDIKESENL